MTSNGQIIRSLDGIKCISEMPPHMYLSTIVEPSLQTILLSKWSTFPRFLSFIISAIIGFLFISYSTEFQFFSHHLNMAHNMRSSFLSSVFFFYPYSYYTIHDFTLYGQITYGINLF